MNYRRHCIFSFIVCICAVSGFSTDAVTGWQSVAPGMDLKSFKASNPSAIGDSQITVLRIDPKLWDLQAVGVNETGESEGHTAREWSEKYKFAATINAGMYDVDQKTHLGYMRSGQHVSNDKVNAYQSIAAFDPHDSKLPAFRIFDLDDSGVTAQSVLRDYASAVQNLRLVKRPRSNRWGQQNKKWSEAALGEDSEGRILFIYSRSPFSMHDLNENSMAWRVPNVLGVRPRSAAAH